MAEQTPKPIIFLAFANEPPDAPGHLRNLGEEARRLEATLQQAKQKGLCDLVVKPYATLDDILSVFRVFRNQIAVFHYGGHAHYDQLRLESDSGSAAADASGLAAFLSQQSGLQLVFLNGCSTQPQVKGLLAAHVPLVIATSQAIRDDVATHFADQFYQSLASGATTQAAYLEAEAAVQSTVGHGNTRHVYLEGETLLADRWPWDLYAKEGADIAKQWNLPDAANNPYFGLPPIPEKYYQRLPEDPFRGLTWFATEHAAACRLAPRNLTWVEWRQTMGAESAYRPTCLQAPIPGDAIAGIGEEAQTLVQSGQLEAAHDRLGELLGWLQQSAQDKLYGEELAAQIAALAAGRNPFVSEEQTQ